MIADEVRTEAYVAALRENIRPGCVVVDIGTGTGIFAMLAIQFGARKVYAIEPGEAIMVAEQIARDNGLDDRIEFHRELSTRIELPEPADVIVSDLHGVLPYFQQLIPSIADARKRLLAPGGVIIPKRETIWAALVGLEDLHCRLTAPWSKYGLDMRAARKVVTNQWMRAVVRPEELLSPPARIATIDYATIEDPNLHSNFEAGVLRAGKATGVAVWFDCELTDSIGFSNAPGQKEMIYGAAFFPFADPVAVSEGDWVRSDIRGNLVGDDYLWFVRTKLASRADPSRPVEHGMSALAAQLIAPDQWKRRAADFRPSLGEDGMVDAMVLDAMAKGEALGGIASRLLERFPARFDNWQSALAHVGELSSRFSK
jgi:protein arginine N-methyltransferase 1